MKPAVRPRTVLSGVAAALVAAALAAAPASAEVAVAAPGCPNVPTVQPFAPWQDSADYFLAPDGGVEAGAAGWSLQGGAAAAEGNEPFQVGAPTDHMSLRLPAGSSATTAPICIGEEHRTMRFFASGATSGSLVVSANYIKRNGEEERVRLGSIDGSGSWAVSEALAMRVNEKADKFDNAMAVTLSFTPHGSAAWLVDDVYVDPYRYK